MLSSEGVKVLATTVREKKFNLKLNNTKDDGLTHVTLLLNFLFLYISQYHSTLRTRLCRDKQLLDWTDFGYESRWRKAEAHQIQKVLDSRESGVFVSSWNNNCSSTTEPSDWLCLRNNRNRGSRVPHYTWFLWKTMLSVIRSLYTETHSPQIKSLHHHLETHGLEAVTAHIQLKLLKAYSSQLNQNLLYEFTIFPALFYDFSSVMSVIYPPLVTTSAWECFWLELISVI